MRLAFVSMETTRHAESLGSRRFERIARLLADRGHEVTIFCAQWWNDYSDERVEDGIRYRGVTLGPAISSFCTRLPVLLAQYGPDVIHARPTPPQQVVAAHAGSKLARAPLVVEWYGDEQVDGDDRSTRWAVQKPQEVITPSQLVRTELRKLGASEDRVIIIPESIDFSLVESVEPAEDVDIVFGHPLDETANLEALLLGLAELREREWSVTIVGDGPKREKYEQEVADLRIDNRVNFVGSCDRKQRLSIYRGARAFVQTAYREYFATELLWALACGCVGIVQYQVESSAHELIENYERSYKVTNPQQMADAIVDAGEFDHQTVDDHWRSHDHDRIIEQYLHIYRELQS